MAMVTRYLREVTRVIYCRNDDYTFSSRRQGIERRRRDKKTFLLRLLDVISAGIKKFSVLSLPLRETARETMVDRNQTQTKSLKNLVEETGKAFEKPKDISGRAQLFFMESEKGESLHHFWNLLNELCANCELVTQTRSLVHVIIALNKKT